MRRQTARGLQTVHAFLLENLVELKPQIVVGLTARGTSNAESRVLVTLNDAQKQMRGKELVRFWKVNADWAEYSRRFATWSLSGVHVVLDEGNLFRPASELPAGVHVCESFSEALNVLAELMNERVYVH